MNKLITSDLGGYRFHLDDLRFMDESFRDGFRAQLDFLEKFNGKNGVVLHQTTIGSIAMGGIFPETYAFVNGEFYKINQTTLDSVGVIGGGYRLVLQTSYQTGGSGTKIFEDGNVHEAYQIRNATIEKVNTFGANDVRVMEYFGFGIPLWIPSSNNSFHKLMKNYFDITTLESNVTQQGYDIATANANIQTNEQRLDLINSNFETLTPAQMASIVRFNTTAEGDGVDKQSINQSEWTPISLIKGKRMNEKTVLIEFNINNIQCPDWDSINLVSLKFNNLGSIFTTFSFTNIVSANATAKMQCTNLAGIIGGTALITRRAPDSLVFNIQQPFGRLSSMFLNRKYSVNPDGSTTLESGIFFQPKWSIKGQILFEIN